MNFKATRSYTRSSLLSTGSRLYRALIALFIVCAFVIGCGGDPATPTTGASLRASSQRNQACSRTSSDGTCVVPTTENILILRVRFNDAEATLDDERFELLFQETKEILFENSYGKYEPVFHFSEPIILGKSLLEELPATNADEGMATFGSYPSGTIADGGGTIDRAVCDAYAQSGQATPIDYQAFDKIFVTYEDSFPRLAERQSQMRLASGESATDSTFHNFLTGNAGGNYDFSVVNCHNRDRLVELTDQHVGTLYLTPDRFQNSAEMRTFHHGHFSRILAHELGHTFGFQHAITAMDGADSTELMSPYADDTYVNGFYRKLAGWLAEEEIVDPHIGVLGGELTIRLAAVNTAHSLGLPRAIRLPSDFNDAELAEQGITNHIWLEYRRPSIGNSWVLAANAFREASAAGVRFYHAFSRNASEHKTVLTRRLAPPQLPGESFCLNGWNIRIPDNRDQSNDSLDAIDLVLKRGCGQQRSTEQCLPDLELGCPARPETIIETAPSSVRVDAETTLSAKLVNEGGQAMQNVNAKLWVRNASEQVVVEREEVLETISQSNDEPSALSLKHSFEEPGSYTAIVEIEWEDPRNSSLQKREWTKTFEVREAEKIPLRVTLPEHGIVGAQLSNDYPDLECGRSLAACDTAFHPKRDSIELSIIPDTDYRIKRVHGPCVLTDRSHPATNARYCEIDLSQIEPREDGTYRRLYVEVEFEPDMYQVQWCVTGEHDAAQVSQLEWHSSAGIDCTPKIQEACGDRPIHCKAYPSGSRVGLGVKRLNKRHNGAWFGACSGTGNDCWFDNLSGIVRARFHVTEENKYAITATRLPADNGASALSHTRGSIYGGRTIGWEDFKCGSNCTHEYYEDTNLKFWTRAASGHRLSHWGGDCAHAQSNGICEISNLDGPKEVIAYFEKIPDPEPPDNNGGNNGGSGGNAGSNPGKCGDGTGMLGDVDGDGRITKNDALHVLSYLGILDARKYSQMSGRVDANRVKNCGDVADPQGLFGSANDANIILRHANGENLIRSDGGRVAIALYDAHVVAKDFGVDSAAMLDPIAGSHGVNLLPIFEFCQFNCGAVSFLPQDKDQYASFELEKIGSGGAFFGNMHHGPYGKAGAELDLCGKKLCCIYAGKGKDQACQNECIRRIEVEKESLWGNQIISDGQPVQDPGALSIQGLAHSAVSVEQSDYLTFSGLVRNAHTNPARSVDTRLRVLQRFAPGDDWQAVHEQYLFVDKIRRYSDQSLSFNRGWLVTQSGYYAFELCVDTLDRYAEDDKSDNCYTIETSEVVDPWLMLESPDQHGGNFLVTNDSGIVSTDCGSGCALPLRYGERVTVQHSSPPSDDVFFSGWTGVEACEGRGGPCTFTLSENTNLQATYRKKGDVDGDGKISATDALLALRTAVGALEGLNLVQVQAADIVGADGRITATDAMAILRMANGISLNPSMSTTSLVLGTQGSGNGYFDARFVKQDGRDMIEVFGVPTAGSTFDGFGGRCRGTQDCIVPPDEISQISATFTLSESIPGDCNNNGMLDAGDPGCTVLCLIGQPTPGTDCSFNSDCNCNGSLDAADPVCAVRRLIGTFDHDQCIGETPQPRSRGQYQSCAFDIDYNGVASNKTDLKYLKKALKWLEKDPECQDPRLLENKRIASRGERKKDLEIPDDAELCMAAKDLVSLYGFTKDHLKPAREYLRGRHDRVGEENIVIFESICPN